MNDKTERRNNPRYSCEGSAQICILSICATFRGKILDVSVDGCLVAPERFRRLGIGDVIEVGCQVHLLPFRLRGTVRTVRSDGGVGIEFSLQCCRGRTQLVDLVKELASHQFWQLTQHPDG